MARILRLFGPGFVVAAVLWFHPTPAWACGACSPEDLRSLATLIGIGLAGWGAFRFFSWAGQRIFRRERLHEKEF